jgi:hypothetical protein
VVDAKSISERISQLIEENAQVEQSQRPWNEGAGAGWIVAAKHVVDLACPRGDNAYRLESDRLVRERSRSRAGHTIVQFVAILRRLADDIERGFLASVENQAVAVVFDDFLDHAVEYLKQERKNEAAVIAGIVFEDTIRRICRVQNVKENGVKLDALITELVNQSVLTGLKAKRARAAGGLRTSAAHARWEEFDTVPPVAPGSPHPQHGHRGGA